MTNAAVPIPVDAAACDALVAAADALARRRAGDIPEATIDRLIALRWLEWSAGLLRLTRLGEIVLMKVQARALAEA